MSVLSRSFAVGSSILVAPQALASGCLRILCCTWWFSFFVLFLSRNPLGGASREVVFFSRAFQSVWLGGGAGAKA